MGFFRLKKNRVKDEYNYIVETICYNELISRGYKVYIGKTYKGEVDFIAEKGQEKFYPMCRKTPCFSYGDIRHFHRIYASN